VRPPAPPTTTRSPICVAQRIDVHAAERLHQAEAGDRIEAERMAFHDATVAEVQPDRLGLGDEIADGEHQSVVDHDAVADALGAERLRGECVGRNDGVQADDGGKRVVEIETIVAGARLKRRRHFPLGQRGHCGLSCSIGAGSSARIRSGNRRTT
jgi:hypothetical protein